MGCCASTTTKTPPPHQLRRHYSFTKSSRAPSPPPSTDEETVKEVVVLSETPTPKPKIQDENETLRVNPTSLKIHEEDNNGDEKPILVPTEKISEISEICSNYSESVSTAKRDDASDGDGEVRQRVDRSPGYFRQRSFSSDSRKDKVMCKSPARRSEPSPGRVRSVPGRERYGFVEDGRKQGSGESSGRRSRSPATRTHGGGSRPGFGRSPFVRRTGKSPGRVTSDLFEKNRKVEEGKWSPTTKESLENPLVSLECFIFL